MNDVGPVSPSSVAAGIKPDGINHRVDHAPAPRRDSDRVELSDQARRLGTACRASTMRRDVIQRVRAEIKANTYETQEKLDIAVERVLSSLEPALR